VLKWSVLHIHYDFDMEAVDKQWGKNKLTSLRYETDYTCFDAIQDIWIHNIV